MSATSHLRDPLSGELIPLPYHNGGTPVTYDIPVRVCPECSEHYPEGTAFEYLPSIGEWVCGDCANELRERQP